MRRIRTIALMTLSIVLGIACLLFDRVYLAAEELNPSSPGDMVVIDGVAVPDIGPLPAFVPMPMGNVNYLQKVDLGSNFTDNQFHNLGVPQEGLLKEDFGPLSRHPA